MEEKENIKEIWLNFKEDNRLEISNTGFLRYKDSKHILQGSCDRDGYKVVHTIKGVFRLHRFVAKYFVPNNDIINKTEVHHKDHNRFNNNANNLEWISNKEHRRDKYTIINISYSRGGERIIKYNIDGTIDHIYNSMNDLYVNENGLVLNFVRDKTYNRYYNNHYYFRESEEFNPHRKGFIRGKVYGVYNKNTKELCYIGNTHCIAEYYNTTDYIVRKAINKIINFANDLIIKEIYNDKTGLSYNTSKDKASVNLQIGRKEKDRMYKKPSKYTRLTFQF